MIAKLIVHGEDREQARTRMVRALGQVRSVGVQTNIAFLRRLMMDQAFAGADLDTGLIERRHASLFPERMPAPDTVLALVAVAVLAAQGQADSQHNTVHIDPWSATDGWRVGGRYCQTLSLVDNGETRLVDVGRDADGWFIGRADSVKPATWHVDTTAAGQYQARVELGDADVRGTVVLQGRAAHVFVDGQTYVLQVHDAKADAQAGAEEGGGGLVAPMPGKIIAISAKAGDVVKAGDTLLVMEAMKMEHTILAPAGGTVDEVFFAVGDQVADGVELIAISASDAG
jgi:3-methylcrotonyl-CoA carboxylase alpha subunit